jgi:hypothetical protein
MLILWGKLKTFVMTYITPISTFIGIAISIYFFKKKLQTNQEELAQLRTAAEQAKITATAKTYRADLEANDDKKAQLKTEALIASVKATHDLEQIHATEAEHTKALAGIDNIKSWEELDNLNKLVNK